MCPNFLLYVLSCFFIQSLFRLRVAVKNSLKRFKTVRKGQERPTEQLINQC